MQQTFLFLDHSWLNTILVIWLLIGAGTLAWIAARKGFDHEFLGALPVWVVGGLIIKFAIPFVMIEDPRDGEGLVLAIRGYGFFLLVGVMVGVGLAMYRARQLGLHHDITLNLCFVLFATGILGARIFYVVQYWHQFKDGDGVSISKIVNMTEGGLVVYGSIIGGAIGGIVYLSIKKLPILPLLDILGPCMMIGLSIGRLGCLMNGCCWGGICDSSLSIQFPEGVAPYARHVETGELFGMRAPRIENPEAIEPRTIEHVEPGGRAFQAGIREGDRIIGFEYDPNPYDGKVPERIVYFINSEDKPVVFRQEVIPERSRPVHPAQIYSSINAFLIFMFLWFYYPSRTRDGQVFALLMITYSIGRSLLEAIRADEMGQFGTELTPAQLTSIATILGGIALLVFGFYYLRRTDSVSIPLNGDAGKQPA